MVRLHIFSPKKEWLKPGRPPSKPEVIEYLVYLRDLGRAPKTLNIHAAAISFFSKALFSIDPCSHFVVRKMLEGWRRSRPPSLDSRRPITFDILAQIRHKLWVICWSGYEARLFSAAFSFAFFGALHIGEVVCEDQSSNPRGLLLEDVTLSSSDVILKIRSSKTDQLGRGALIRLQATQKAGPCSVKDARKFMCIRPKISGPFFVHADGSYLSKHQFTRVMRKAVTAIGLPPEEYAAHSLRIGAATTAVHMGLPAERIMDMGRWKSNAYRGYLRNSC